MAKKSVKVAVIGSGLTGLTAAYLLTGPLQNENLEFEVHLYEKEPRIGMDSASIDIPAGEEHWRIDVPMRSFQGGYYPRLISFYRSLGVLFRKSNFSYSFSTLAGSEKEERNQIKTTMIYNGSSGLAGVSTPSALWTTCSPFTHRAHMMPVFIFICWAQALWVFLTVTIFLVYCYLRTLFYAAPAFRAHRWKTMAFSTWASETAPRSFVACLLGLDTAWKDYTQSTLLPLFSAVCTAPKEDILTHPVEEILDFIWLTLGTDHYVVIGGVQNAISKLKSRISHIHLSSFITAVEPDSQDRRLASITYSRPDGFHVDRGFHHVIFATEATCAAHLLSLYAASLTAAETRHNQSIQKLVQCLSSFHYCTSVVLNHTDRQLLPKNELDIRDLNFIFSVNERQSDAFSPPCVSPSFTMTTHVMLPPKGYPHSNTIFQTTNPIIPPKSDTVLSEAKLPRAVLTLQAKEALKGLYQQRASRWWQDKDAPESKLGVLQGAGRLGDDSHPGMWICGSYAYPGIPLLEGCVVSSRNVVEDGIFRCEGVTAANWTW